MQPSFPIASVIEAASRNAQLQEQARQTANKSLIEGLQGIGQIGESLFEQKKKVANALVVKKTLFPQIPDEDLKDADPDVLLKMATIQKGMVQSDLLDKLLNRMSPAAASNVGGTQATSATTPTAGQTTPDGSVAPMAATPTPKVEATLASTSPTIPISSEAQTDSNIGIPPGLTPPATGQVPVPIAAPPLKPQMVNPATINAAIKMGAFNKPESVFQYTPGKGLEKVGEKNKGDQLITSQPKADTSEVGTAAYAKNQQKLEQQYTQLKAKALSNRSGGLGLEDAKVGQAIHLRRLVNQFYDPKTGQYNIPKSQYGELTNGLATLLSPGGRPGIEVIHELQQKTAKGDLGGALAYMGITDDQGNVPTGSTQSVLKMLVGSIDRQGEQAEQNRQGYFDYIHGQAPTDLEPARIAKHDKQGLNSFSDFLNKAPDRMPTAGIALGGNDAARLAELRAKKAAGTLGR